MLTPILVLLAAAALSPSSSPRGALANGLFGPHRYSLWRQPSGGVRWEIVWEGVNSGAADTVADALRDVFEAIAPYAAERDAVSYFGLRGEAVESYAAAQPAREGWSWGASSPTGAYVRGVEPTRAAAITTALRAAGVWT